MFDLFDFVERTQNSFDVVAENANNVEATFHSVAFDNVAFDFVAGVDGALLHNSVILRQTFRQFTHKFPIVLEQLIAWPYSNLLLRILSKYMMRQKTGPILSL